MGAEEEGRRQALLCECSCDKTQPLLRFPCTTLHAVNNSFIPQIPGFTGKLSQPGYGSQDRAETPSEVSGTGTQDLESARVANDSRYL